MRAGRIIRARAKQPFTGIEYGRSYEQSGSVLSDTNSPESHQATNQAANKGPMMTIATDEPAKLVTHRFELSDILKAYETFGNTAKEHAPKVVLVSR